MNLAMGFRIKFITKTIFNSAHKQLRSQPSYSLLSTIYGQNIIFDLYHFILFHIEFNKNITVYIMYILFKSDLAFQNKYAKY